jgi:hypothetical protein
LKINLIAPWTAVEDMTALGDLAVTGESRVSPSAFAGTHREDDGRVHYDL